MNWLDIGLRLVVALACGALIARLSLEESISAVRWEVASADAEQEGTPFTMLPPRLNLPEAEASV
jgi:uncharacterized membrane-anchored protein YhcB (DUF1043 family)